MEVICFGDSNTYGYNPRGYFGGRYDADSRWVDILAAETDWTVYNMGQNGREIPSVAPAFGAMTRTADGWIFWLQRPDGQSITWARMARRSHL